MRDFEAFFGSYKLKLIKVDKIKPPTRGQSRLVNERSKSTGINTLANILHKKKNSLTKNMPD